jgi:membrane protein
MVDPSTPLPADRQRRLERLLARGPQRPTELSGRSWWRAFVRTVQEFLGDDLTDRAAALTYYSVQSIFPGLLVLVSLLGFFGGGVTQDVLDNLQQLTPGPFRDFLTTAIGNLQRDQGIASVLAIVGLVIAFWSASAYIGAFMRAANKIYDVPEGRPVWKTYPIRIAVTLITGVLLVVSLLTVVLTGRLAEWVGNLLNIGQAAVDVWDYAKWPVLLIVIAMLFDLLYWAAPNARQGGWKWITPGTILAIVVWLAVSAGFAFYVSSFASYNKTYGAVGAIIVFLIWLWLSNVALLLGAEFDAELARRRAIEAGLPPDAEPYLPMRQAPRGAVDKDAPESQPEPTDREATSP